MWEGGRSSFSIFAEILPPFDGDIHQFAQKCEALFRKGVVEGITLPSSPMARMRPEPTVLASYLHAKFEQKQDMEGKLLIPTITARDHTALSLRSNLLSLRFAGIHSCLLLQGDVPHHGVKEGEKELRPSFAQTSAEMVEDAHTILNSGTAEGGEKVIAAAVNFFDDSGDEEYEKTLCKVKAGATHLFSQPLPLMEDASVMEEAVQKQRVFVSRLKKELGEDMPKWIQGVALYNDPKGRRILSSILSPFFAPLRLGWDHPSHSAFAASISDIAERVIQTFELGCDEGGKKREEGRIEEDESVMCDGVLLYDFTDGHTAVETDVLSGALKKVKTSRMR
eukprot:CAMPEP_0113868220 /NCGR_PEP_ID=MMETSP0780_2-20120614/859_1 /TAXON_ID=652834 /ORGANISM="Palpitomonas bilix" /LENGTH=336 /DNA_ID=CAMNT_0000853261 /DNA_START=662 /DNA_END=1672 /DNA_ORIENTATION=- /assembly_acc=CAM_ASM_000599